MHKHRRQLGMAATSSWAAYAPSLYVLGFPFFFNGRSGACVSAQRWHPKKQVEPRGMSGGILCPNVTFLSGPSEYCVCSCQLWYHLVGWSWSRKGNIENEIRIQLTLFQIFNIVFINQPSTHKNECSSQVKQYVVYAATIRVIENVFNRLVLQTNATQQEGMFRVFLCLTEPSLSSIST